MLSSKGLAPTHKKTKRNFIYEDNTLVLQIMKMIIFSTKSNLKPKGVNLGKVKNKPCGKHLFVVTRLIKDRYYTTTISLVIFKDYQI